MDKIAIAGFGLEGRALYELLKEGADIHVFDEAPVEVPSGVEFHPTLVIPADFGVVYKSPGIPTAKLSLTSPRTRVSTLMDVVLEKVGSRAVGVTGTKGKSTVVSLIHRILRGAGKESVLFGNIGVADTALLKSARPETLFVIEMSSYQLEHVSTSPHIAVVTGFYQEHLDHHGSLEKYRDAKFNISRFQLAEDVLINGADIDFPGEGRRIVLDSSLHFETKLLGEHNQKNCALAFSAALALGVSEEDARKHIATFEPLPYRLEHLGVHKGITFYDDSLATIPEATLASLGALERVDTLIVGGQDRGISFNAFSEALAASAVKTLVSFPETGPMITEGIVGKEIVHASSMEEAVRAAYRCTPEGGTVLLSNASPSFNMFKDYKDKSAQYRHWIQTLADV
ncbi:hypothetical protein K2P56_04825 [Patescibacteria group bacterium]|nr:hypothetical protein [Patescibacteria group bacterium]